MHQKVKNILRTTSYADTADKGKSMDNFTPRKMKGVFSSDRRRPGKPVFQDGESLTYSAVLVLFLFADGLSFNWQDVGFWLR